MLRPFRSVHPKFVPSGSLVTGAPGKVRRPLTPDESASIQTYADNYVRYRLDFQAEVSPA